jgi:DNA-binding SARP family transcriptional activator
VDELRIQLLGGFGVSVGGRSIPDEQWRLRKLRNLVKLLALAPAHRLHRDQIIDLLWPGLDPEAAANQLRKRCTRLAASWTPIRSGRDVSLSRIRVIASVCAARTVGST